MGWWMKEQMEFGEDCEKQKPTCLNKAENDPGGGGGGGNRLMTSVRGGVSLRPRLSVTEKRWGRGRWKVVLLEG